MVVTYTKIGIVYQEVGLLRGGSLVFRRITTEFTNQCKW